MQAIRKGILFLVQYPENVSPAQRFRIELYKDLLAQNNFDITTLPFINNYGYTVIFETGFFIRKSLAVLNGFFQRLKLLFGLSRYEFIFVQSGITPIGPPIFEWILIKLLKKKVIYDLDGATWIEKFSEKNKSPQFLRSTNKVSHICRWSYKVSCGNEYLCKYARRYNNNVIYNPTCVDTERSHNILADHDVERVTIGWTGSFSTLKYMDMLGPVLRKLQEEYDFDVKIICNQKPALNLKNLTYVKWSPENEVIELAKCQIGLMPLTNDQWSIGKCGFKLIQYLALEIPAVSSPVGVNTKIIDNNLNGFLCESDQQWYDAIKQLILDSSLRKQMGKEGRKKIIREYSLLSNQHNFLSLFS